MFIFEREKEEREEEGQREGGTKDRKWACTDSREPDAGIELKL